MLAAATAATDFTIVIVTISNDDATAIASVDLQTT